MLVERFASAQMMRFETRNGGAQDKDGDSACKNRIRWFRLVRRKRELRKYTGKGLKSKPKSEKTKSTWRLRKIHSGQFRAEFQPMTADHSHHSFYELCDLLPFILFWFSGQINIFEFIFKILNFELHQKKAVSYFHFLCF